MKRFTLLLTCFFISMGMAMAQNKPVKGIVVDEAGEPIIGASVLAKGTTSVGTQTGVDGSFSFNAPGTVTTLVVKYIGMKDQEVAVGTNIRVVMKTAATALDEVVVVAYGEAKKIALTGAVNVVGAKEIEKRPITSAAGVLEGKLGVQVNNTYGQPGTDPTVRIRGFTTIYGSNSPLYVIDGVPFSGNISDLNPQDIESMSVLKDAQSASLYGTRASNGVILITTKKGKSDSMRIRLTMNQGTYNRGIKEYKRMGANDFMETMWSGYRNNLMSTQPAAYPTKELANAKTSSSLVNELLIYNIYNKANNALFDSNGKLVAGAEILDGFKEDLDWYGATQRQGYRQEYGISGDGGSQKSSCFFSASYLNEKGYVTNSGFERYTGRAKIDLTPKSWFKTGFSLSGSYQVKDQTNGSADASFTNPFMYARNIAPIYPIHLHDMAAGTGAYVLDESGNKIYDSGTVYPGYIRPQYPDRHVVWENELNMDRFFRTTLQGALYAEISFLKDFKFRVNGNMNNINEEEQGYDNAIIGDGKGNNGRAGRTSYRFQTITFQEQLSWSKIFNNVHSVDAMVSHENFSWNRDYTYGRKANETFTGQTDLINFTDITSYTGYTDTYRLESYLARARYNFKEKYFAEAAYRRDGSSRFHPDNRWGNFWSVGGNWIITNEDFMSSLKDKINFMKLRASYGEVGNDQSVGYYGYMALYSMDQNANKGALYKSQNEAKDIKWESAASLGVAVEGRAFDCVDFSVEYFDKRSNDLLFDVNLPLSAGGTTTSAASATVTKNIGSVSNKGVEIGLNVDIFKSKDWKWSVGGDVTFLKNEILKLPEENRKNGIIEGTKKYMEGHGIYDFWLYQYAGVDQMTGNSLYKPNYENYYIGSTAEEGKNQLPSQYVVKIGDDYYSTNATYAERNWSGSAIPDFQGSLTSSLSWKDLSLSALVTYSSGGKLLDYSYQSLMIMSGSVSSLHSDLLKAWKEVPENMTENSSNRIDPNGVPIVDFSRSQYTNATSTRFLHDLSYLVVKNINLGYTFPKSFVRKLDLSSLTVNATIENLVTFTKMQGSNPQQSFNGLNYNYLVTPRVFSFGLNVQF